MDRRSVIKQMALSGGVVLTSGSIVALLQSCKSTNVALGWKPQFFSNSEMSIITSIANEIMPKDHMPSASEVNVPQFIDLLFLDVFDDKAKQEYHAGIKEFSRKYKNTHGEVFEHAEHTKQSSFVQSLYNVSAQDQKNIFELLDKDNTPEAFKDLYVLYRFLTSLRELTIDTYFTSETIGEQYLAYDPVPGTYEVDYPVDPSTKVWSL